MSQIAPSTAPAEGPALPPDLMEREGITSLGARNVARLSEVADLLSVKAKERSDSLVLLVDALQEKSHRLASMPSVWPAKGWLTSRFGPRMSPFTGRRSHHAGIDIASRSGTPILAPARGRVKSVGSRGPLGNSLTIDHGYGLKTFYGHTKEIFVKVGDTVERGQKVAEIGSTGRSTGPHLHYAIHVKGKARDPLNYIFD
jgi:murein DD-endopeptidase MepM/ murein hydrolase activator NlpD